ncbi:MAG: metal-dependent hydrolase [Pseudonocardia sp.]|nr:metal-dependent hydrolase [Pseudonocardia sp.]
MMGRTHALTGWCAGLALAPVLGQHSLAGACSVATVTAGFALLPDLDQRSSTASRLLGPLTRLLSAGIRHSGSAIYRLTKGPRDEPGSEHRTFWHTLIAAALLGVITGAAGHYGGSWVVLGVLVFAVLLAVAALGDWILLVASVVAVMLVLAGSVADTLTGVAGWLGYAVAAGCVVHDLGDALTEHGVPLLWPIPIRGETFYELGLPKPLRFHTGGIAETVLHTVVLVPTAVLLIPGVWPLAWALVVRLTHHQGA